VQVRITQSLVSQIQQTRDALAIQATYELGDMRMKERFKLKINGRDLKSDLLPVDAAEALHHDQVFLDDRIAHGFINSFLRSSKLHQ
jgi:hypothetical protein